MNTHDIDIELPPLPRPHVPRIDADVDLMDIRRLANWCEKTAKDYAREAVRLNSCESRASTHAEGCWSWGPGHYGCAVGTIERLREQLRLATVDQATAEAETNDARAENERLREALKEIRSRSSMNLAMHPNPFELTALLGDIHQIADAALSKENKE
ncbi:MAG TPA: hypothetical protein VIK69_10310 [Methylophilaceae bacterium]